MSRSRPGLLALRAVNQYRRRDVVAYLGLRYYLESASARHDRWANDVACSVLEKRAGPSYFESQHFKEFDADEKPIHRTIYVPGPNEAYAEASLLAECAAKPEVFRNPDCVFSYSLAEGQYKGGAFVSYMHGIRRRQAAISRACDESNDCWVRFVDIRRFYPSITTELASNAWQRYGADARLSTRTVDLGSKLLTDYGTATGGSQPCLLTGPMFSHLLANLVLREIDTEFGTRRDVRYIRYVDDMTLVGPRRTVDQAVAELASRLADLGLDLHDDESAKSVSIPGSTWLEGRHDFAPAPQKLSWLSFTRDVKQFLVANPDRRDELSKRLQQHEIRTPVRDFSQTAKDAGYVAWFKRMLGRRWFRAKAHRLTPDDLLAAAHTLRSIYEREFSQLLDQAAEDEGYSRKRLVPKLRMRAAGLVYFSSSETLQRLAGQAADIPELAFYSRVMRAVATGDVTSVLGMGTNVTQAVAQALRASGVDAVSTLKWYEATKAQSVGVLALNGVPLRTPNAEQSPRGEFVQFAQDGASPTMMQSADDFIRELASLHGASETPRHSAMLETAFDEDEEGALDAFSLLQGSLS